MSDKNKKNGLSKALSSFGKSIANLFTFNKNKNINNLSEEAISSPTKTIVKNFVRNKLAMVGLFGFIIIFLLVVVGSILRPINLSFTDGSMQNVSPGYGYIEVPSELQKNGIKQISTGITFSVGLDDNGKFYIWGVDTNGVMDVPAEIQNETFTDVAAGNRHVLALSTSGKLYMWGSNSFEQASLPLSIETKLIGTSIKEIGAGENYSIILTEDNNLLVWGSVLQSKLDVIPEEYKDHIVDYDNTSINIILLLDDGTTAVVGVKGNQLGTIPEELTDKSVTLTDVAAANYTGLALDSEGKLHTWGVGTGNMQNVPSQLLDGTEKVKSIEAGSDHFIALTESGNVYAWGGDTYGQSTVPTGTTDVEYISTDYSQSYAVKADGSVKSFGNNGYLFGTDDLGRDLLTRLLHGGRITMVVAFVSVVISTIIGITIGLISGFYGGIIDKLLMRFAEIISSFPFLPLAITLSAMIGSSLDQTQRIALIMAILGFISWPGLARLIRGQILAEREKEFVLAARALGIKQNTIILKHILPNIINLIIVSMTLDYAGGLLTEAGLSYLGFGVLPPNPSWGNMLTGAQSTTVIQQYWWRWIIPATAVLLTALTVNLIGDGLRDAMDPKANEK